MYQLVLFDLDGTLTDPGVGITNSVAHALKKFGLAVPERAALYKFIGPPLHESFERYYGFSQEQAQTAVAYYREYFREKGIYENFVYDGVEELLKALRGAGRTLAVATSKPEVTAVRILEHFGMAEYFDRFTEIKSAGNIAQNREAVLTALLGRLTQLEEDGQLRRRIREQMETLTDGRRAWRIAERLLAAEDGR